MIKHIVMYRLKDRTRQNADALCEKFMSMQGKIEVLRHIEAGADEVRSDRSFDVVLVCRFDSMEDMEIYKTHPVHLPVMAYVREAVEKSHSVDFIE